MSVILRAEEDMTSRPGDPPLFETEAVTPSAKKNLTAAKHKLLARSVTDNNLGAGSVYRVLIYSIEKANSYGAFWKKNSTIAREIGIDRSTVIEALNRLTLHGYIERIGRYNGIGNSSNVYVLALDLGGAVKAAIREARRRAKFPREQESNSTGNPPPRCSETPTPGVVIPRPQESSNRHTYTSLPMNPSLNSFSFASLADPESEKQVVQQGSSEGFEGVASIGEDIASGTICPGKPSPSLHDTEDPISSSPDEPLSSTLTVNRPIPAGAEGPDHAQRSLGPIYMVNGGREKADTEDLGYDDGTAVDP